MLVFFLFILGLSIGSFLNVLIDRIPQGLSPFKGRSYCDKCKKTLKWYYLIPLISYLYLKGKCRYCKAHISFYYPLVELITGVMFVILFLRLGNLPFTIYYLPSLNFQFSIFNFQFILNYFYYAFILSSFIVIFFTDLKYGIIPDKILYPAVVIFTIYHLSFTIYSPIVNHQSSIINNIFSGVGAFLFFLALYVVTKGKGMGFGDVKLAFLIGIVLGFPKIITALYLAFLTGAIVGSILIIWRKKKLKGGTIPFGPFLIIGAVLSLFFGEKILRLVSLWLSF
ncbi:MAG: prepilin peptidase [Patescibacteria group bacterium]